MSRSLRKTPIFGIAKAESEKLDKRRAHHAARAHFRTLLGTARSLEQLEFDERNVAHSNVYSFGKDGKRYSAIRVRRDGRALVELAAPRWAHGERPLHRALAK